MFTLEFFIGLALIGIVAGFASGLLGVGGGFLIVPLQYFLLEHVGVDPGLAMLVSLGTSLAIIIPTSCSSAYKHTRTLKNVIEPGIKLGVFGIIGGLIGGGVASILPSDTLKFIFGCLLIFIAIYNCITINKDDPKSRIKFNIFSYAVFGTAIGFLSGLLGIGGGIFLIVCLVFFFGFSMLESIGTSSVYICLTAIGGVISYIITGMGVNTLPFSIGYVSLIDFVVISVFSVPLAYFGAKVSHKLPERNLKLVFAVLVFIIGLKMIGVIPS